MNKKHLTAAELRELKTKHRLELIMQEMGESFEADPIQKDMLRSTSTPGLSINPKNQTFELTSAGRSESGDVFTWLRLRNHWTFPQALRFLKQRPPDPKNLTITLKPREAAKKHPVSAFVNIYHEHIDPQTGAQSYGLSYNWHLMDEWQRRAVELAGQWALKYFDMSSEAIWYSLREYPHRFRPIVDFSIDRCADCEKSFAWQEVGMIAFAQEEERPLVIHAEPDTGAELESEAVFTDADFVICETCMREKYMKKYKAMFFCYKSALKRLEGEEMTHIDRLKVPS